MAEGIRFNTDGTTTVAIDGKRRTLAAPTLGDLEDLRGLFRDVSAEREDWLDLTYRPGLLDLQNRLRAAGDDGEERSVIRKELRVLQEEQDHLTQDAWATWWRECFDRLCRDPLPEFTEREAEGLPVWMTETANTIGELFAHWRTRPTLASGAETGTQRQSDRAG